MSVISGELARASGGLGALPLIVLSAGQDGPGEDPQLADRERKLELRARLARLSARGRLVVVKNSGPGIPFDAPESVVDAVRAVIGERQ